MIFPMLKHMSLWMTTRPRGLKRDIAAIILMALAAIPAAAHEYWLEPVRPVAAVAARLVADARVGQFLETKPETLTWESREKFLAFLEEKKLEDVYPLHRRRGLPEAGFSEHYVRHAKALLLRGKRGSGPADRALGMALELVALDDPFALSGEKGVVRVRLLWRGRPLPDTDVQVFASALPITERKPVRPLHLRTDDAGVVHVPVRAGVRYMLNAVRMEPLPEDGGAVWMSHWASLTFMAARGSRPR